MAEQNPGETASAESQGDGAGPETEQRTGRHAAPDDDQDATTGGSATDGTPATATAAATTTDATATSSSTPTQQVDTPAEQASTGADAPATRKAETPTEQTSATSTDEPATRQVETPTQVVEQPGSEQPTRVSPVPQEQATQKLDRPQSPPPSAPTRVDADWDGVRRAVRRVTGVVATLLRIVGLVLALVLVAYVVLTLTGVNPENGAAQLVAQGADALVMRFRDLFLPADPRVALVVGYGLAALFWLVVGLVAARVVRAVGRLV